MRKQSTLKSAFMLVGIITVSSYHSLAAEWQPNPDVVKNLISLSEAKIKNHFPKLVAEHERTKYAILVSHYHVFESNEDKKAQAFLEIAQAALGHRPNNMHAVSVNMLHAVMAEKRYDHISVARYGEKTLGLMRSEATFTLDQIAPLLNSVSDAYYKMGIFRSALRHAKKLAEYAKKADSTVWEAQACFSMAEAYYKLGQHDSAEKEAQKAYALYLELDHTQGLGHAKKVIGNSCLGRGRLNEAQENYEAAISHYQKANDEHGLANCYFNLGLVLKKSEKWKEAVDSLETASLLYAKSGSAVGVGIAKMELGCVLSGLADFKEAEILFSEAKRLLTKTNSFDRLAQLDFYKGYMYIKMGQKQKAIKAYNRALNSYRRLNNGSKVKQIEGILRTLEEQNGMQRLASR